jgi:uncharacterized phage protein (TIGR01671 family)
MNREILFRGRSFSDGGWVFGDVEYERNKGLLGKVRKHTYKEDGSYNRQYLVESDTVGQFTGLLDKNGNKIYEGDIVRKRDLTFCLKFDGVVVYNSEIGCFRIHSENNGVTMRMGFEASDVYNDGKCTVPVKYDYEVIGNIYDNFELLAAKQS